MAQHAVLRGLPLTSIFDRWTDLDPALALRRIEAAHGSAIFDSYAYLDPQRAIKQIEVALGINIDDVAGVLDLSSIDVGVDAALEGGNAPEWVPANAKIYIDLIAPGRAWTEDDGEVAIDTLLGTDSNTENGWDATAYDAGALTSDGYVVSGAPLQFAFIGDALSRVLDAATVAVRSKQLTDRTSPQFALLSANGNDAVEFYVGGADNFVADSYDGSLHIEKQNIWNVGSGAISVFAATITATRAEFAANGCDPQSAVLDNNDRPAANPLVAALIQADTDGAIQSITIYDALPSTAGLSALSETGVTNTAPHSISVTWENTLAPNGVIRAVDLANTPPDTEYVIQLIAAIDDQGSPVAFTLTDDIGGALMLNTNPEDENFHRIGIVNSLGVGDHHFTLRATDPGGLYVEQQFTITVTA